MNVGSKVMMALLVALVWSCASGGDIAEDSESAEEKARWQNPQTPGEELAAEVFKAHGGAGWEQVQKMSFRFVLVGGGERVFEAEHHWDVREGLNRVIWEDEDGRWDVVVNLETKVAVEGTLNGEEFKGDERMKGGRRAHRRWINDSYWLLMPIKMLDDGVKPVDEPRVKVDEEWVDVVLLTFEAVGLTPDDRYWVYIDPESRQILGWDMVLEDGHREEPRFIRWSSYQEFGPLLLPTERHWRDGDRSILFEDVDVEFDSNIEAHSEQ